MGWKCFTPEEVQGLKMNPYTHTVTDRTISFTAEFKRIFWERMQSGESPIIILQDMGYDPGVLGKERIHGIRTHIKEQVLSGEGIHEGRRTAGRGMTVNDLDQLPPSKSMIKMVNELAYLRQEVEFLKKAMQTGKRKTRGK